MLGIFVPVMKALKKVHGANILHRDLKPDNIYIRSDRTPLLLDFGAARQKVVGKNTQPDQYVVSGICAVGAVPYPGQSGTLVGYLWAGCDDVLLYYREKAGGCHGSGGG